MRIERSVVELDPDTGIRTQKWKLVGVVWAAIEPLSAREFIAAASTQSAITAKIIIRFRPDVDASMRIVHGSRVFNIAGVLPDLESGREYLTLPCSAGANDGQ